MEKLQFLKEEFKKHSLKEYPNEACGIITKDFKYIPCKNISKDPINSFVLDPLALLKYEDNCWGFFHSHPDEAPTPSILDGKKIADEEYTYLVGWEDDVFVYWYDKDIQSTRFKKLQEEMLL